MPAIVEGDDLGTYVLKFRGAGQGVRALLAEIIAGGVARALGLPVPEIVLAELDTALAQTEPDPEIQDLIRASGGINLGLDYLSGALAFDPLADDYLRHQYLRPLAGATELEHVHAGVVRFDDRGQRTAFAQRGDVAGGGDGSHSAAILGAGA